MNGIGVLCVDSDQAARADLAETLRADLGELDPTVEECASVEAATRAVEEGGIDCLVTEYGLPDGTGLELAERFREAVPDASVVLFTDRPYEEMDTDGAAVVEHVDKGADAASTRVASLIRMTVSSRSQVSYPLPDTEDERLAALESYEFDTEELERSFDRITDLATRHFDVELASLNLIERSQQRMLACQGMGTDSMSTSRDASICTFTIVSEDRVMTVEDVHDDPRFEGRREQFDEFGIRSYMGARLETPTGYSVGTLCIYGAEPQQFSPAEQGYLRTLSELAVDLLAANADDGRADVEGAGADADADDDADDDADSVGGLFE
jgi:GAF domain-containing protein